MTQLVSECATPRTPPRALHVEALRVAAWAGISIQQTKVTARWAWPTKVLVPAEENQQRMKTGLEVIRFGIGVKEE